MAHSDIVINDVLRSTDGGKGFAPGGSFGPSFDTQIVRLDSGAEYRTSRRPEVRRYEMSRGAIKATSKTDAWPKFLSFLVQNQGALRSFLLEDPSDFSTLADGRTDPTTVSMATVQAEWTPRLSSGAASGDTIQLVKRYDLHSEIPSRTRVITRPKQGTVAVVFGDVLQEEGVNYTVDYSTGIVTLASDPGTEVSVFAECQFYVPVRFDEATDQFLGATSDTGDVIANLPNLSFVEVTEYQHGTESRFFGGLAERTSASSFSLSIRDEVTQIVTMTAGSLTITLPDPNPTGVMDTEPLMTGGPYFVIVNKGSNSFQILSGLTPIATLAQNDWAFIDLQPAVSGQRQWVAF